MDKKKVYLKKMLFNLFLDVKLKNNLNKNLCEI